MEVDISYTFKDDSITVNYQSGLERLLNYMIRHKEVKKENLSIREYESVLIKKPRGEDFYIGIQNLKNVCIEKINNDLRIIIDLQPFTLFTIHVLFNSENHVEKVEIKYIDDYFKLSNLKIKMYIRAPQVKKRFSLFK